MELEYQTLRSEIEKSKESMFKLLVGVALALYLYTQARTDT